MDNPRVEKRYAKMEELKIKRKWIGHETKIETSHSYGARNKKETRHDDVLRKGELKGINKSKRNRQEQ